MGASNIIQSARALAVTKSDSANIPSVNGADKNPGCVLYVGGAGNAKVTTIGGDVVVFKGLAAGTTLQVKVVKLWSADTTVTDVIALW